MTRTNNNFNRKKCTTYFSLHVCCPPAVVMISHTVLSVQDHAASQRWASTLANRSNARHRSNIRAPPTPLPPDVCTQRVGICVARGAGSDS